MAFILTVIMVGSMAVDVLILDKAKNKRGEEKCQKKD
jgi:hypothetical protein